MAKKEKKTGEFLGFTDEGEPLCITQDGKIIVGKGCMEIMADDKGNLFVTLDEEKCPTPNLFQSLHSVFGDKKQMVYQVKRKRPLKDLFGSMPDEDIEQLIGDLSPEARARILKKLQEK